MKLKQARLFLSIVNIFVIKSNNGTAKILLTRDWFLTENNHKMSIKLPNTLACCG
jgi:hypothetical protein